MRYNGISDMLGRLIIAGNYLKLGRMPRPGIVAYVGKRYLLFQYPNSVFCDNNQV